MSINREDLLCRQPSKQCKQDNISFHSRKLAPNANAPGIPAFHRRALPEPRPVFEPDLESRRWPRLGGLLNKRQRPPYLATSPAHVGITSWASNKAGVRWGRAL